ncbi:MAG: hypothetical protein HYV34_01925 [Candidatus Kerfeldbacteria bacterium]|nr:hypothetical protein [Candidatus Kerfeldbacteria bacterium]
MQKPIAVKTQTTVHPVTKMNLGIIIVMAVFNLIFLGALLLKGLFSALP